MNSGGDLEMLQHHQMVEFMKRFNGGRSNLEQQTLMQPTRYFRRNVSTSGLEGTGYLTVYSVTSEVR